MKTLNMLTKLTGCALCYFLAGLTGGFIMNKNNWNGLGLLLILGLTASGLYLSLRKDLKNLKP